MTGQSVELPRARILTILTLLWFTGSALRLTILALPPAIPNIQSELHLSATQIGILSGLPSLLFALAAVPGSLLIARFGALPALVAGLVISAAGGALRGAVSDVLFLYAMTIVMGAGVAVMQVSMPSITRLWAPKRIGFATAVYTNGLLLGEIFPVALTIPLIIPLTGSWQRAFAFWSVPVVLIALAALIFAPRNAPASAAAAPVRQRWWPDWNDGLIWKLGLILGTINTMYFATNAFLPDYLAKTGQSEWISAALTALNVGQLPASFVLLAVAGRLERAVWPYVLCGCVSVVAVAGLVLTTGIGVVISAAVLGCFGAAILVLALALPLLLAPPDDVHRVTAAMFTISYSSAVIVPVIAGALWDLTGWPPAAFICIGSMGVLAAVLAPSINHVGQRR